MKKRRLLATEKGHCFASLRGSLVKMLAVMAVCLLTIESGFAQTQAIKGVVTEANGTPIIGATVMVKGTTIGDITGANGQFSVNAAPGATLQVSFMGYITEEVNAVTGQMTIRLAEDSKQIEDVVVVGYGTSRRETLTGAISSIKAADINTTTHTNFAQSLQGKVSGLQIRQNSGEPGSTNTFINVRGFGTPLYVIDGVVRDSSSDFQKLNAGDIESITVLKDGSAAIYGLNAQNGVIIVTTKSGTKGKPTFNYDGAFGITRPTDVPRMSSAIQYVELINDSFLNANEGLKYSKNEVDKWRAGTELGFKGTNWYDEAMREWATQTTHDLSIQGGDDLTTFYISMGYQREMSLLASKDDKYEKYNLRSKINTKLANNLTADINLFTRFDTRKQPNVNFFNTFKGTRNTWPTLRPFVNDNPLYPSSVNSDNQNPVILSDKDYSGWTQDNTRTFQATGSLTWDIPWVKGLKARGQGSYDNGGQYYSSVRKSFLLYNYDAASDSYTAINPQNAPAQISNTWRDNNRINLQAQLSYQNTFNDEHNVSALMAYEQNRYWDANANLSRQFLVFTNPQINQAGTANQTTGGSDSETRSMSLIGKVSYDFRSKYLIEYAFRYNGSYRYHPDRRWGFFPVISGGWRASEENFIKNNVPWLTNLKLRGSWGQIGEDAGNAYQYVSAFTTGGSGLGSGAFEFTNGTMIDGVRTPAIVNDRLTWFTSTTVDFGVEIGLFNKIDIEFDWYKRDRSGLLATRASSLPNTFGAALPQENLNGDRAKGIDMSVGYNDRFGDVTFGVKANANLGRQQFLYQEGAVYSSSWNKYRNGTIDRNQDIGWGFKLNGRFTDWNDIATSIPQNGSSGNTGNSSNTKNYELPGDYKFVDLNNNGIKDDGDQSVIFWHRGGTATDQSNPKFFYGITIQAAWKGFDINMLFQGSALNTVKYGEVYGEMIAYGDGRPNIPEYFYDRWHVKDVFVDDGTGNYIKNPAGVFQEWVPGKWPASRINGQVGSIYSESSLWRRNAAYFRFKNVELGYTIPSRITQNWGIQNLRFYANAHNIFTLCDPFLKAFDPERTDNSSFAYPVMRSFNFGVNLTF